MTQNLRNKLQRAIFTALFQWQFATDAVCILHKTNMRHECMEKNISANLWITVQIGVHCIQVTVPTSGSARHHKNLKTVVAYSSLEINCCGPKTICFLRSNIYTPQQHVTHYYGQTLLDGNRPNHPTLWSVLWCCNRGDTNMYPHIRVSEQATYFCCSIPPDTKANNRNTAQIPQNPSPYFDRWLIHEFAFGGVPPPHSPLPWEVGLKSRLQLGGPGECCKLPQRGPVQSPAANTFLAYSEPRKRMWRQQFQWFSWESTDQIS